MKYTEWEIKDCKVIPNPVTEIELRQDNDGNVFMKTNVHKEWVRVTTIYDDETNKLTIYYE